MGTFHGEVAHLRHPKCACRAAAFGMDEQLGAWVLSDLFAQFPGEMAACTWHSPIHISKCRPVRLATCWPRNMSGRKSRSSSAGSDSTTSTALEEVQQRSDSAFTAAEVLT